MKRLIPLIGLVLVVILAGSSASAIPCLSTPIADSSIPDDDTITCQTEASDSSSSSTIAITMTGVLNE